MCVKLAAVRYSDIQKSTTPSISLIFGTQLAIGHRNVTLENDSKDFAAMHPIDGLTLEAKWICG